MAGNILYEDFLYQYELLRTRFEIQKYFLNTVVKEVYENIGQVLTYVRMQYALERKDRIMMLSDEHEPGYQLIGKTISDLRNMCTLFDPEEAIIKKKGFWEVIKQEVKSQFPQVVFFDDFVMPGGQAMNYEKTLVVLGIILELLQLLKSGDEKKLYSFSSDLSDKGLQFVLQYAGPPVQQPGKQVMQEQYHLSVFERASLLGGVLQAEEGTSGVNRLLLKIPFNQLYGER